MINPLGIQVGVIHLVRKSWIPADPKNSDWREFLNWQTHGNEPMPYDETKL